MNLNQKKTQKLSREDLLKVLKVARLESKADLLLKNAKILDLVNGEIIKTNIAIVGDTIAGIGLEYLDENAFEVIDLNGKFVVPGFIDGHLHIESSMMNPFEFEKMTLPLGTTTIICDPHEITNVLGEKGFSWFLRCSDLAYQNQFVQASSCVPALKGFETNGGDFDLDKLKKFKDHSSVLGLAEMMNFPGVINGNSEVLDKIEAFSDLNLDGHSPLLRGKDLNAYLCAGIQNCHETVLKEEGKEKLQKGMSLIIREGSVAKNLNTLAPLVSEYSSMQCLLCTDDRNPFEIKHEGHINFLVKKLIKENNIPVHVAYRLSSFSAAKHFGLKRLGLIAPGKQADLIVLENLEEVQIEDVMIKGKWVTNLELNQSSKDYLIQSHPPMENTINRKPVTKEELSFNLTQGTYNVIGIIENEIITEHKKVNFDGNHFLESDILYMVNVERYGKNLAPAKALVQGMGLKNGAIACSVAHDSHNLICIGDNLEDMAMALNHLIQMKGGLVLISKNKVVADLALPIAGLMSLENSDELILKIKKLKSSFKELSIVLHEPFIQMAFLALPVIPSLKLTDKGLFDVKIFNYIDLKV